MTAAGDRGGDDLDRRAAVLLAGLCLLAVVVDAVWLSRLATPGTTPSLLLVLVVAVGLHGGPAAGAVAGLSAGLLADLAPPTALVVGTGAAGLAVAGSVAGALVARRRSGPHRPRPWARTLVEAGITGLAAPAGGAITAAALAGVRAVGELPGAADTPAAADAVLPGIGAGAAYAAVVALVVLPAVRGAARRLTAR